jgi:deoxyribonuclease-1-like protein
MKKLFLVFCQLLFLFSAVFSATPYVNEIKKLPEEKKAILFVSWNIQNFGKSKTANELAYITRFVQGADIVAIQEVSTSQFGAQAVAELLGRLNNTGSKWDSYISDPTHESPSKERYAFLWKTSRIKMSTRSLVKDFSSNMEREPLKAEFLIDGWTFLIATLHLVPTDKNPKTETDFLASQAARLSSPQFILAGDFNLSYEKIGQAFEKGLNVRHQIEGKTTLKNKISAKGEHLLNEFDNIYTRDISVLRSGIMDTYLIFGSLPNAKKVSDHLPVFIVFKPY